MNYHCLTLPEVVYFINEWYYLLDSSIIFGTLFEVSVCTAFHSLGTKILYRSY